MNSDQPTKTLYAVLGIDDESASPQDVKKAWQTSRVLVRPDAGGSSSEFRAVQNAGEVLTDPALRREYDAKLREARGYPPLAATEVPPVTDELQLRLNALDDTVAEGPWSDHPQNIERNRQATVALAELSGKYKQMQDDIANGRVPSISPEEFHGLLTEMEIDIANGDSPRTDANSAGYDQMRRIRQASINRGGNGLGMGYVSDPIQRQKRKPLTLESSIGKIALVLVLVMVIGLLIGLI